MLPETRYAERGGVHIAYQVTGDEGESDLVLVPEFWHSIEAQWDEPALADFLMRLSSCGRLISFDQRGTGVSDPVPPDEVSSLEEWLDPARLRDDYVPRGWNPPDTRARPIPGHRYGLSLSAEDKRALIAFLKTL